MPKKFAGENTKSAIARIRKTEVKQVEKQRIEAEKEDAYWRDDDKHVQRKLQRKEEADQKRQEQMERKQANKKAHNEEIQKLSCPIKSKVDQGPVKVTKAQIDRQKELENLQRQQETEEALLKQKKIIQAEDLSENINQLSVEEVATSGIDQALQLFQDPNLVQDKHPEKRVKAAYQTFEEIRLPQLKEKHPTFRLSQLKQLLKKEWQKSPENPLNQKIMNIIG